MASGPFSPKGSQQEPSQTWARIQARSSQVGSGTGDSAGEPPASSDCEGLDSDPSSLPQTAPQPGFVGREEVVSLRWLRTLPSSEALGHSEETVNAGE